MKTSSAPVLPDALLREVAARFPGFAGNGKPAADFVLELFSASDGELYALCEEFIYLAERNRSNPRSEYHWKAEALQFVCARREKEIYEQVKRRLGGY